MTVTPAPTAVTKPEEEPMTATAGLLLDHVPPGAASVSVVVRPAQSRCMPTIGAGTGLTVTGTVT
jgi:hypothetical protein